MIRLNILYYFFLALFFHPPAISQGILRPDLTDEDLKIDCKRQDLNQYEIEKCNIIHGLKKVTLLKLPDAQERERLQAKVHIQRQRLLRVRQSVEDMFNGMLLSAAYHDSEPSQKPAWNKLFSQLHEIVFENYITEVHYLNITDPKWSEIDTVTKKANYSLKYQDNDKIISVVVFKPELSHQINHSTPLGIFNHGGLPNNYFGPNKTNVMLFAFADLGYAIACPNYRGGSPENHAEDMTAVVNYFRQLEYVDPHKIVLAGISAGTTLNAKILDKPIMGEFAGLFLHTGIYNQSVFDPLIQVSPKLPVFIASGRLDELVDLNTTLKYIRAFEDISDNLAYIILENGGHQLIKKKQPGPLDISYKTQGKYTRADISKIAHSIKKFYNSTEVMNYVSYLVEFLNKVAHPEKLGAAPKEEPAEESPTPKTSDIIKKAQILQRLKSFMSEEKSFGPSVLSLNQTLKSAPYSFSQSQLKILLDKNYDAEDINITIEKFLKKYDLEKPGIRDEFDKKYNIDSAEVWTKRIGEKTAQNNNLRALIHQILKREVDYKGSYVLYHGADSKAGFLYDVYSRIQRLLLIQPKSTDPQQNIMRLRALSDAFVKILSADDLIQKMKTKQQKYLDIVFNYLPGYPDVGISAQWFLFGSYKYWFNSTFFRYFLEDTTSADVSLKNILSTFFAAIGITDKQKLEEITQAYEKIYAKYIQGKNGILLQIFVSPEIIDEVAYVSETGGFPLKLIINKNSTFTYAPSEILPRLVEDPLAFEKNLEENRSNFVYQGEKDRSEFSENKAGLAYVNSVEARFFMKPEYMDDPRKIQIFNYQSPPHDRKGYDDALDRKITEDLALWLSLKPKLGLGMTHSVPKLLRLQKYIEAGMGKKEERAQRTAYTLYDLLSAGKWNQAKQWLKEHPEDINIKIDDEGRPLLYQLLFDNKFQAAQWLVDHGASVNDTNNKKEPIILDLLDDNKTKAVEFLFKNLADVQKDVVQKIELSSVIQQKRTKTALWLIQNGAKVDGLDDKKNTPLIWAALKGLDDVVKSLIDKYKESNPDLSSYLNHKNIHGANALLTAIDREHQDAALALINAGTDIDALDEQRSTPLLLASGTGLVEVVKALIEKKKEMRDDLSIYLNRKNQYGLNALILAILRQNHNIAMALVDAGADINAKDSIGVPVLFSALYNGDFELAQLMLDKGANLRATSNSQNSNALIIVLISNDKFEAAKFLTKFSIKNNKPLNITDTLRDKIINGQMEDAKEEIAALNSIRNDINGKLWRAFSAKNWQAQAEEAIKENPSRNLKIPVTKNGAFISLLYHLLMNDKYEQAQWLMDNGADVNGLQVSSEENLKYKQKNPILLDVLLWGPDYIDDSLRSAELLIKNGADVNATYEKKGISRPILYELLLKPNREKEIEYLISKGADVNLNFTSGDQKYPFLLALLLLQKTKYRDLYSNILIKNGARVNALTGAGESILAVLLKNNKIEAAKYILGKGGTLDPADLDLKTTSGNTIRELITQSNDDRLLRLIP